MWSRSQTSFLFAVALGPALFAELARGLDDRLPWYWAATIIAVAIVVLLGAAYSKGDRQGAPLPADGTSEGIPLAEVRHLVATANSAGLGTGNQALHTLIRQLPELESISLVLGDGGPVSLDAWSTELHTWLANHGFDRVRVDRHAMIAPYKVVPDQVAYLAYWMSTLPQESTVVDVTGGTAAMSIATFAAAERAGYRASYTPTHQVDGRREFGAMVEISTSAIVRKEPVS